MTDRELLELAAKAAGYDWHWYVAPVGKLFQIRTNNTWVFWSPLTDDGDALRLAVKLGISISFSHSTGLDVPYPTINEVSAFAGWSPTYFEANYTDWSSATRRAIVRAAAEIGRGHE